MGLFSFKMEEKLEKAPETNVEIAEQFIKEADKAIVTLCSDTMASCSELEELNNEDVKMFNTAMKSWRLLKETTIISANLQDKRYDNLNKRLDGIERKLDIILKKLDRMDK